jgi:hypothetical protein
MVVPYNILSVESKRMWKDEKLITLVERFYDIGVRFLGCIRYALESN